MTFDELAEFKKDLKTLLKKYRTLNEDLDVVKKVLGISPGERPPFSFRIDNLGLETCVIKVKKMVSLSTHQLLMTKGPADFNPEVEYRTKETHVIYICRMILMSPVNQIIVGIIAIYQLMQHGVLYTAPHIIINQKSSVPPHESNPDT